MLGRESPGTPGNVSNGKVALAVYFCNFLSLRQNDNRGVPEAGQAYKRGAFLYFLVAPLFPFYSAALLARFDAANLTHDNFRWALLPVWIVIVLLFAGVVWRWTGRSIRPLTLCQIIPAQPFSRLLPTSTRISFSQRPCRSFSVFPEFRGRVPAKSS